jgi:hypothetical protein
VIVHEQDVCLMLAALGHAQGRRNRSCRALIFCVALTVFAPPGNAQELRIHFDIPAQPLATALEAFSGASGYQILMAETVSGTTRSNAVKGALPPEEALAELISGTGLEARVTGDRAAIIVRDADISSTSAASEKNGRDYDATLQRIVMTALCRDAATRPGPYRAALDLWVASSGRVERTDLLGSTGDPVRDNRIEAALDGLGVMPPPPGMAQPTTLLVLPVTGTVQSCETALAGLRTLAR